MYSTIFNVKQNGRSLSEYYSELKGLFYELNIYPPTVVDLVKLQRQRKELYVSAFVYGLDGDYKEAKKNILASLLLPG